MTKSLSRRAFFGAAAAAGAWTTLLPRLERGCRRPGRRRRCPPKLGVASVFDAQDSARQGARHGEDARCERT